MECGCHALVQVKENQKELLKQCRSIAQEYNPYDTRAERNKGHGRQEQRTTETFRIPDHKAPWFAEHGWQNISIVVAVTRERSVFDTKEKAWNRMGETSLYVATTMLSARESAHAVRSHWGIENRNHYVRDETLGEDRSRIRKNPENMAKLRSMSLNLLRATGAENISQVRFRYCININALLSHSSWIL